MHAGDTHPDRALQGRTPGGESGESTRGAFGEGAHSERIGVGGGDDSVVRIQLAARWAETFAPPEGDSLRAALDRFRRAYDFLDAVTHGIEPPDQPEPGQRPSPPLPVPQAAPLEARASVEPTTL